MGCVRKNSGGRKVSRATLRSFAVLALSLWFSQALALGVGGVSAHSYIGEPLSASIPIFNVVDPDSLEISLTSASIIPASGVGLAAELDRSNSQLTLRVRSERPIKEPYLTFTIRLNDQGNALNKDFTLLLNLAPASSTTITAPAQFSDNNIRARDIAPSGAVLGPYDWAEPGAIPPQFGAVLDGQSLWRVARRINRAMGVSINQMMWALYQQNPDAFVTDSVDSLKAGSYLKIPAPDYVRQVSDQDARQALANLSAGMGRAQAQPISSTQQAVSQETADQANAPSTEQTDTLIADPEAAASTESDTAAQSEANQAVDLGAEQQAADQQNAFRVGSLDEVPVGGTGAADLNLQKSQEIIASLAATVGNLSQELIQKDKRIDYLENRLAALEELTGIDADSIAIESSQPVSAPVTAPSDPQQNNRWYWIVLFAVLLITVLVLMKDRLAQLIRDLNLFGTERAVDLTEESNFSVNSVAERDDDEVLAAVNAAIKKEKHGVRFIDLQDVDPKPAPRETPSGIELDESNLNFDERFENLIQEQDYSFALELLDFARHNEIEEDQYHCERLRLYQLQGDEDGFYAYYYNIESDLPNFDANIQNRISQLVVKLAHTEA